MSNTILQFASVPQSLNLVEKMIDELRIKYNIPEECYGNMLVALTEAVNNAIHHGNGMNPDKFVRVRYSFNNDSFCFHICDEGIGFDYYNLIDPTSPENLEKPSGRGIFLMKQLSDQLIFSENGRAIEMYFKSSSDVIV
jgi:serine/threonine-protein kinase RsbW